MSRTIPNNRSPLVYVPDHKKFLKPNTDSCSSIGDFLSTHSSDERKPGNIHYKRGKRYTKKLSRKSKAKRSTSSSSTEESTPSLKNEKTFSIEESTEKNEKFSTEKSTPSSISESSPSTEKSPASEKKKSTSLRKKRTASQAFPSKQRSKRFTKFKHKLSKIGKKKAVSSKVEKMTLRQRSTKRKISSSENEHVYKKQPKDRMETSKSISDIPQKYMILHDILACDQPSTSKISNKSVANMSLNENSAITLDGSLDRKISSSENEHVSKKQPKEVPKKSKSFSDDSQKYMNLHESLPCNQPSTSKILNKSVANMSLNENSAITLHDSLNNSAPNCPLEESSDMMYYEKLSGEKGTAMPSKEFSANDSDINNSVRNEEIIENKDFCQKNISDSSDISAAGKVDRQEQNIRDSIDMSESEVVEEKKKDPYVVYENDYHINAPLIAGNADTSSIDASDEHSSRRSLQEFYRKRLTKGTNPLKLLCLKEILNNSLPKKPIKRQKTLPETSPMKSIPEEGSSAQKSDGGCADTSEDPLIGVENDENSPETCEKNEFGIKISPLPVRMKNAYLDEGRRWILFDNYRILGRRHTYQKWFKKYSKRRNKWWIRVLRYIRSIMPELKYESEPENCQSGVNVPTIAGKDFYLDEVNNLDVAAEISIGNIDIEEEINLEAFDLEEEIDVETIDFEEETDEEMEEEIEEPGEKIDPIERIEGEIEEPIEEIEEKNEADIINQSSASQSPKIKSSIFFCPGTQTNSPENESSDFHSPDTESSESESPKKELPNSSSSVKKLVVRKSGENEASASQRPGNGSSAARTRGYEASANQPPGNETSARQPPANESPASKPPESDSSYEKSV